MKTIQHISQQHTNMLIDMPTKKLLYVDMDDVLCSYSYAYNLISEQQPDINFPQSIPGFFKHLQPLDNAIKSFFELTTMYDVHILSAPSIHNPLCYTEKRIWVEDHLGFDFVDKLILATNKGLLKGDYLIDDYVTGRGQEDFDGELIHFGSSQFPNWDAVVKYLRD